ncbi:MAG: hypothetical protein BWY09_02720 [Candidatus Hydrogenedentes bacterium ADurb.Bin179]|nr:MAG: hypothetical protein BWY09_02720 [Candidatus Hydrogenedentes bacterium ADurb.Bin179]
MNSPPFPGAEQYNLPAVPAGNHFEELMGVPRTRWEHIGYVNGEHPVNGPVHCCVLGQEHLFRVLPCVVKVPMNRATGSEQAGVCFGSRDKVTLHGCFFQGCGIRVQMAAGRQHEVIFPRFATHLVVPLQYIWCQAGEVRRNGPGEGRAERISLVAGLGPLPDPPGACSHHEIDIVPVPHNKGNIGLGGIIVHAFQCVLRYLLRIGNRRSSCREKGKVIHFGRNGAHVSRLGAQGLRLEKVSPEYQPIIRVAIHPDRFGPGVHTDNLIQKSALFCVCDASVHQEHDEQLFRKHEINQG